MKIMNCFNFMFSCFHVSKPFIRQKKKETSTGAKKIHETHETHEREKKSMKSILYAIEIIPELTDYGIGTYFRHRPKQEEVQPERERQQKLLVDNVTDFEEVCKWLDQVEKTKQINRKVGSSYSLKHIAEKDTCNQYVSRGFEAPVDMRVEFDSRRCPDIDLNPPFNKTE